MRARTRPSGNSKCFPRNERWSVGFFPVELWGTRVESLRPMGVFYVLTNSHRDTENTEEPLGDLKFSLCSLWLRVIFEKRVATL